METIRVFAGFDPREEIGLHVFTSSVLRHATLPTSVTSLSARALAGCGLPRAGSNAFTYSRFLVPWLCDFAGWALFVDGSDMVACTDLAELWALRDPAFAVQVVKHDYRTRHPRKYVGTVLECENRDYERKQWASVMLINCAHPAWHPMTPELIAASLPLALLQLRFIPDHLIGELPPAWNWICDEQGENPDAKLLHFTAGFPAFDAYTHSPHSAHWFGAAMRAMSIGG